MYKQISRFLRVTLVKMYTGIHGGIQLISIKPCTIHMGILLLSAGGSDY